MSRYNLNDTTVDNINQISQAIIGDEYDPSFTEEEQLKKGLMKLLLRVVILYMNSEKDSEKDIVTLLFLLENEEELDQKMNSLPLDSPIKKDYLTFKFLSGEDSCVAELYGMVKDKMEIFG